MPRCPAQSRATTPVTLVLRAEAATQQVLLDFQHLRIYTRGTGFEYDGTHDLHPGYQFRRGEDERQDCAFDRTCRLVQVMRHQGEDELSTKFLLALRRLRESKLSRES